MGLGFSGFIDRGEVQHRARELHDALNGLLAVTRQVGIHLSPVTLTGCYRHPRVADVDVVSVGVAFGTREVVIYGTPAEVLSLAEAITRGVALAQATPAASEDLVSACQLRMETEMVRKWQ